MISFTPVNSELGKLGYLTVTQSLLNDLWKNHQGS
jgi:hypothetical protein